MDRHAKRMKITNPDVRNPRGTGSKMTEGLFTSEMGIRGDDPDKHLKPTRTLSLSDFQRRSGYGAYARSPRPAMPRRNAGTRLRKRVPDATVTASVVEINVNDGTTTSKLTEVPAATASTVLSISDIGPVTLPGAESTTSASEDSSTTTPPPTTSTFPDNSTTSFTPETTPESTSFTDAFTNSTTTSEEFTVTVTHTSTLEVTLFNGTIIATGTPTHTSSEISSSDIVTHSHTSSSSSTMAPYTFGQPISSSTSDSLDYSGYSETTSDAYPGVLATGAAGSPTTSSSSAATSTSEAGSGSGGGGGPSLSPVQQQVVGGVVGGVAGVAVVLLILLVLLRWYRRRLKSRGELPEQIAARQLGDGNGGEGGHPYPMSQRSSMTPLAAAMASSFKRLRPHSNQTLGTTHTGITDPSVPEPERGFQRIAGRKLGPVLSTGGDPYGGNYGAFEKEVSAGPSELPDKELSDASFYRDNDGFYGGKGLHSPMTPSSPTIATPGGRSLHVNTHTTSKARDFADPEALAAALNNNALAFSSPSQPEGFAVIRPSPARTPVTLSPAASSIRLPIQQVPTLDEDAPPLPTGLLPSFGVTRDEVGRSLASMDGSRVSRSSGRSAGRFVENI